MKIFVSYSFNDSELYIITLLLEELRRSGFFVESSDFYNSGLDDHYKIQTSDYFIGIITNNTASINEVVKDWDVARSNNVKTLLLIEQGVRIKYQSGINYILFNRLNPKPAIDQLLNLNRPVKTLSTPEKNLGNAVAIGAIAVGLAALISMLSNGDRK
jgi:hypothetical protein